MSYTYISQLADKAGGEAQLRGWVANSRSGGKIRFLILRDGTGYVQCVAGKGDVPDDQFELLKDIGQESSVAIKGTVREDKRAPGGYEIILNDVQVIGDSHDFPITPKEHGSSFLLDHRHLWLRSRKQHAVLSVRHHAIAAIRDFLNDRGFYNLDTPIFTPNACEGTSTLFNDQLAIYLNHPVGPEAPDVVIETEFVARADVDGRGRWRFRETPTLMALQPVDGDFLTVGTVGGPDRSDRMAVDIK